MRRLVCTLLAVLWPVSLPAQSPAAHTVGLNFFHQPLAVNRVSGREIAVLAAAAGVPMGFEADAAGTPHTFSVQATGRTLGTVLDDIVAADRRYEWRDEGGVLVVRPAAAWTDGANPLHRNVGPVRFADVGMVDCLALTAGLFGHELDPSQRSFVGDAKRFDLDLPPGTVLDALNGMVRAHGGLTWILEPSPQAPPGPRTTSSPYQVSLASGPSGGAQGIGVYLGREPRVPDQLVRIGAARPAAAASPLDRVVGRRYNDQPVTLHGMHDLPELAYAAQAAMGVELLPPPAPSGAPDRGILATGLTLRDVLTALVARDSRYEWREIDAVIVVRPIDSWGAPEHPLMRPIGPVHLERVTLIDAITYQHALLEPGLRHGSDPMATRDTPRVSVDLPGGTHLALVNAIVRSYGSACWTYEDLGARETAFFGGRPHQLSVSALPGGGQGFAFR